MIWNNIRGIGRLQVLSKASILMLAIVPILASVWPTVRAAINRYNQAVSEAKMGLNDASRRFENILDRVDNTLDHSWQIDRHAADARLRSDIAEEAKRIANLANEFSSDFGKKTITSPFLPKSWAIAFFAAFFVILGRTLFQSCCPERVQQYSVDEYASNTAAKYAASPSVESLNEAISEIRRWLAPDAIFFQPENRDHRFDRELVMNEYLAPDFHQARIAERQMTYDSIKKKLEGYFRQKGICVEIPSSAASLTQEQIDHVRELAQTSDPDCYYEYQRQLNALEEVWPELVVLESGNVLNETPAMAIQRRSAIVQRAARRRYRADAEKGGAASFACAGSYATALLLILWIIMQQALAVGEAAGIWNEAISSVTLPTVGFVAGVAIGLTFLALIATLFSNPFRKVSGFISSLFRRAKTTVRFAESRGHPIRK